MFHRIIQKLSSASLIPLGAFEKFILVLLCPSTALRQHKKFMLFMEWKIEDFRPKRLDTNVLQNVNTSDSPTQIAWKQLETHFSSFVAIRAADIHSVLANTSPTARSIHVHTFCDLNQKKNFPHFSMRRPEREESCQTSTIKTEVAISLLSQRYMLSLFTSKQ